MAAQLAIADEHSRSAPRCSVRGAVGSRVALQFSLIMNKRPVRIVGPKIEVCAIDSVGHRKNWRRICGRCAGRLSGRTPAGLKRPRFSVRATPRYEQRSLVCLAAHFLHAIVVSVDFMTFQNRNMRDAAEKLAGAVDSKRLCGIDRVSFLVQISSCNLFKSAHWGYSSAGRASRSQ